MKKIGWNRGDFNKTWLTEMPQRSGPSNYYQNLLDAINDRIRMGLIPVNVCENLYKIGNEVIFYWYQDGDIITLAVELQKYPEGLAVLIIGKNPAYKGKSPYASQLYHDIIQDAKTPIRLYSDIQLSDEEFSIWKKLFDEGNSISIYDRTSSGQSFIPFTSIQQMNNYFGDDPSFRNYQFVISEAGNMTSDVMGLFEIRRARELGGLSLED